MRGLGLKERLKVALKHLAPSGGGRPGPRILTYHSVGDRDHPMNVTAAAFRDQMAWLADHHPVIRVEEALEGREGVAVTFDDGYRDNLLIAHPILAEHGIPWTLFFVTGRAGGGLGHDRAGPGTALLTWDEVRLLHSAGVSIGGHTMNHPRLSRLPVEEQRREIEGCYNAISSEVGSPPSGFAYPFGSSLDFGAETVGLVRAAGFTYAVSNRYGPVRGEDERWSGHRIWVDRTDTQAFFRQKVDGRLDRLALLDSWAGIRARRLANLLR